MTTAANLDSTELPDLPPALKRATDVVLPLATCGSLDHFLERFLGQASRWLRLPWWLVHAALYVGGVALSLMFADQSKFFPRGGNITLCGVLAAEFVFTTWMLLHLRQARTLALLAASRLESGEDRLTWMRTYFGSSHWGWVIGRKCGSAGNPGPICLRLPGLTLALVAGFYLYLVLWGTEPGSHGAWQTCRAHLFGVYALAAKAAMLLAVLAHFWLLRGLVRLLRGEWENSLNDAARLHIWADTCRLAVQLNVVTSAAAGIWMFVHGLALGVTGWSWLLSISLLAMFIIQDNILGGTRIRPGLRSGWIGCFRMLLSVAKEKSVSFGRTQAWVSVLMIACPVGTNLLGAKVINLLMNP
jgi:hypothetical protein